MYEVRIESHFCAAHFLSDYHGKCEHLHGHNYRVIVCVKGSGLDGGGMLLDFGVLKDATQQVCDTLDHSCLNDIQYFDNNPSAERIARYIYENVASKIGGAGEKAGATLFFVEVWETDKNCARYYDDSDEQNAQVR